MAQAKKCYPKFNNSFTSDFWLGDGFTLPANKKLHYQRVMNQPPSLLFEKGATTVAVNRGMTYDPQSGHPIPRNRRSVLMGCEFLRDYGQSIGRGGLSEFSQAECYAAVDNLMNSREGGYDCLTTETNEAYGVFKPYEASFDDRPQQSAWISERFSYKQAQVGGRHFGNYGGVVNLLGPTQNMGDTEFLRAIMANPQASADFLASHSSDNFFNGNGYTHRCPTVNTYWMDEFSSHRRLSEFMLRYQLVRLGMQGKGVNKPILDFGWPCVTQTTYTQPYVTVVPDTGGVATFQGFPQYADTTNFLKGYIGFQFCEEQFSWENGQLSGWDKNNVNADFDGFNYSGPPKARTGLVYEFTDGNAPYPSYRYAGHDHYLTGIKWWCESVAFASQSWQFAQVRPVGSDNWGPTTVLDLFQQAKPFAMVHTYQNRRSLLFFDLATMDEREYEVNLGGGTTALQSSCGVPIHEYFTV